MPLNQSKLLIRVDVGPDNGCKQVACLLALANEFKQRGGQAAMVVTEIPNSLERQIENERINVHQIGGRSGDAQDRLLTRQITTLFRPTWLLVDGQPFDGDYLETVAHGIEFVMATDGIDRGEHTDLVVGTRPDIADPTIDSCAANVPMHLAGPSFALVDPHRKQPTNKKTLAVARKILVWNQGPDIDNWTLRTLQSLSDQAAKRLTVDCIVSDSYQHVAELNNFKRHSQVTLRIHKNADRLEPLAERADLAIANGHAGCYRLAYLGVPTILVTTPESNSNIIAALHRHRAAYSLAHQTQNDSPSSNDLNNAITKLIGDRFRRHSMSRHGMDLIDGLGPKRVLNQMARRMIHFRLAGHEDCESLWSWRNDPETRSVALNPHPIAWPDHRHWFDQMIFDEQRKLWFVEDRRGETLGCVGFQFSSTTDPATIQVILDPKCRGRGLGAAVIESAIEKLLATTDVNEVVAQIRSGNIASEKSFRRAGFHAVVPRVTDGVVVQQLVFSRHRRAKLGGLSILRAA